ncbi:uncharacterized protein LOC142325560 isoform X2 [Lycorma delicatula]|uniref:uncharacterized protein LOC142325560 isoform X2 n=1 Tax=Lycorma delicatula TaxID=130591 RepID=UPI003F516C4A
MAVIQLGHSSRWPENVEAIRRIHAAFVTEIAKALKEQCNLLTQVFPDHVRIFKVKEAARLAMKYLDNSCLNSFQALFMTHMPFLHQFDHVIRTCGNSELIVNCHCGVMKVRPLQLASSLKNQQDAANIVKLLLDHGAKLPVPVGGRTPLHEAVKGGHITCVKILLEKDANVNASDENSLSPLLLASAEVTSGNNKILSIERYENIVNQLVSKGANVNMTNEITKCTPLHYSVEIGSVTATTILI